MTVDLAICAFQRVHGEVALSRIIPPNVRAFLGKGLSNILTTVVFSIMHTQVTYAAQMLQFLVIVLLLSLIWGVLIQKSNSLWEAVLFHAAGDCLVIFGAFAST
jgi:membrane protease YdiL (CAAX protease family)